MRCHQLEVAVRGEHDQLVPATELRQQCVDRADLDAPAATRVAQASRFDMVESVGHKERERPEALHDGIVGLRAMEPL
jgi:hypothetical protein